MPSVIRSDDLPTLESTRDGRHRIDLVTEELFGFTDLKADHITYRPGDTAAAHYHVGARHIWFVSEGSGVFHLGDETFEIAKGDVATAADGEIHWFENPNRRALRLLRALGAGADRDHLGRRARHMNVGAERVSSLV